MEQRFGIANLKTRKKCNHWMCRKPATIIIGDVKQPHLPLNYCLCDEHAQELLNRLAEKYNFSTVEMAEKMVEKADNGTNRSKSILDGVMQIMYATSGKISKTDLIDLCKDLGIELPKNAGDLKIKELIELLAPDVKENNAQEAE